MAEISAIIVNYNAGSLLRDCIDSLLACPLGIDITVVDNASADNSLDALDDLTQIKIIRNEFNAGFAAACNIGIESTTSDYILFLNPDCTFSGGTIEQLLTYLQTQKRLGMVGGLLVDPDGTEQGGGRRSVPTPWRSLVRASGLSRLSKYWPQLFDDFYLYKQPLPDAPIEIEAISGACMLVKRAAVDDVGLWDEGYFLHCEDLDYCMRFRQNGWTIGFVPTAKIVHIHGGCSQTRPIFVEWHKHKGMVRFYRKFFKQQYPSVLMPLVVIAVWCRFYLLATYYTIKAVGQKLSFRRDIVPAIATPEKHKLQKKDVGVIGATSFVGNSLLPMLTTAGYQVAAFSRKVIEQPMDRVSWQQLSLTIGEDFEGTEIIPYWICVAPIKILPDYFDFLESCGVRRIVVLSSTSRFTKGESSDIAEQELAKSFIDSENQVQTWAESKGIEWVILRPTLIYGLGQDKNITEIARFIRRFHFFPLLGSAKGLRQPVRVEDVASASFNAFKSSNDVNQAYNISGSEILTYREMVERVFDALGKSPRFITIPFPLFKFAVACARLLPRYRNWSVAMAERMDQDMIFEHIAASRDLDYKSSKFVLTEKDIH